MCRKKDSVVKGKYLIWDVGILTAKPNAASWEQVYSVMFIRYSPWLFQDSHNLISLV